MISQKPSEDAWTDSIRCYLARALRALRPDWRMGKRYQGRGVAQVLQ